MLRRQRPQVRILSGAPSSSFRRVILPISSTPDRTKLGTGPPHERVGMSGKRPIIGRQRVYRGAPKLAVRSFGNASVQAGAPVSLPSQMHFMNPQRRVSVERRARPPPAGRPRGTRTLLSSHEPPRMRVPTSADGVSADAAHPKFWSRSILRPRAAAYSYKPI